MIVVTKTYRDSKHNERIDVFGPFTHMSFAEEWARRQPWLLSEWQVCYTITPRENEPA